MRDNPGAWLGVMVCCVYPLLCIVIGYALGWRKWIPRWIQRVIKIWDR